VTRVSREEKDKETGGWTGESSTNEHADIISSSERFQGIRKGTKEKLKGGGAKSARSRSAHAFGDIKDVTARTIGNPYGWGNL